MTTDESRAGRCTGCLQVGAVEAVDLEFFGSVPYRALACGPCSTDSGFVRRVFERIFGSP